MKFPNIPQHNIADDAIRHACSEIYLTIKHSKRGGRIDDQEYQLIIAKLGQIESALIIAIESQLAGGKMQSILNNIKYLARKFIDSIHT